jgi:hypothetical protein
MRFPFYDLQRDEDFPSDDLTQYKISYGVSEDGMGTAHFGE